MKKIGYTLKVIRQEKSLTLFELANKSGVSKGLLSKIENNLNTNPSLGTLNSIAEALNVTIGDIIGAEVFTPSRMHTPREIPSWVVSLKTQLALSNKKLDEDILQSLYLIQNRKAENSIDENHLIAMYNMLEMTFSTKK